MSIVRFGKAFGFAILANCVPLLATMDSMLEWKIAVLVIACMTMILTQPDLEADEARDQKRTDRYSVVLILGAGVISQVIPVIEWAYLDTGLHGFGASLATICGLLMIVSGLAFRIWSIRTLGQFFTATVQIRAGHRVIQHGPYAIVRHPSYLGAYVAIIGAAVFLNAPYGAVIAAVLMMFAYRVRIAAEERTLLSVFGDEYREYRSRVPGIIPRFWQKWPTSALREIN